MDPISTIADTAALGGFLGATYAYLRGLTDEMSYWLIFGTIFGGAWGVGRALAGL